MLSKRLTIPRDDPTAPTSVRHLVRGWGPFSGTQLTIVIVAFAAVLIPTAASAAIGAFTSTTATPAVSGTNSSSAVNAKAVFGNESNTGANARYGVLGTAAGTGGVGVWGTGAKYGVYSNGPLFANGNTTINAGKTFACGACVTNADLANGSVGSTKLAAGSVGPTALSSAAKATRPLASGESESGVFGASGGDSTSGLVVDAITFVRPLSAPLTGIEDTIFTGFSANCPGVGLAAAGWLCLYGGGTDVTGGASLDTEVTGVVKYWGTTGSGTPYVAGQYTVTSA